MRGSASAIKKHRTFFSSIENPRIKPLLVGSLVEVDPVEERILGLHVIRGPLPAQRLQELAERKIDRKIDRFVIVLCVCVFIFMCSYIFVNVDLIYGGGACNCVFGIL